PQREIGEAAFDFQRRVDDGEFTIVGVNRYVTDEEDVPLLHIDPALETKQVERLTATRAKRNSAEVESALTALKDAAAGEANLMYPILDAARVHTTEGEMIEAMQEIFGTYTETPVF
ncbi:MAG: methylmalonyl-CoA mutase, partial [Solirubrobacterales bacterium]|nr:methylmalonyl-CoA mutase [Solirubrobacterales bacterium]